MIRIKSSRLVVPVVLAAAVIVAAGGVAIASNMGFKLNQPLTPSGTGGGFNWTSLPYFNPYVSPCTSPAVPPGSACVQGVCAMLGLPNFAANITQINPVPPVGTTSQVTCGAPAAQSTPIPPGRGIRILGSGAAFPPSVIIVGSHNPAMNITLYPTAGPSPTGHNWISIPYHTTAVTFANLCTQFGLPPAGNITHINPVNNVPTQVSCIAPAAALTNLVLGRAVRVLTTSAVNIVVTPAHF